MRLFSLFLFLLLVVETKAFEARAFRRTRRIAITVGDVPDDAFSSVAGVSLSYRDVSESSEKTTDDDVVRAHSLKLKAGTDQSVSALTMIGFSQPAKFDGTNVTIVVLDSGCEGDSAMQPTVPVLVPNEPQRDLAGHGTAVMRTLRLVAPRAAVLCLKIFDRKLVGTVGRTMQAFAWSKQACSAAKQKCVVVLAGGGQSVALSTFVGSLVDDDFTVVASAGNNEGKPCDDPANAPNVVSVGALGATGKAVATYSATGPCVSLLAPGWIQLSEPATVVAGTSFSAALVAGIAALLVQNTQQWRLDVHVKPELVRGSRTMTVRGAKVTNTTTKVAQVPPYAFPTEVLGGPPCWGIERKWFVETPGRFSFVARNFSLVVQGETTIEMHTQDGMVLAGGGKTQDADDDRRVLVVDGASATLCSPRACFLTVPFATKTATLGLSCDSAFTYFLIGVAQDPRNETSPVIPLMPPCAQRLSPVTCAAKPVSPADSSCVWMGAGFRCIRADYCGFRTRAACARRSPTCTWVSKQSKCANA